MSEILNLSPQNIWKHFYALTQIPRPSGHEEEVISHIKNFADELGLENELDEVGNIIIRKPAAAGKGSAKTVVLQAHVDMVPQKNSDKVHDFEKDPIEPIIDGEWLRANKTTLGADNGMGVAAAMAVLESNDITHGPLEVLFTINEEAGMDGAFGLSESALKADILLNLDSEDEGELFIGCAGGVDVNVSWSYPTEIASGIAYRIKLSGLKGGHSGLDIHLKRGNANKILAKLLMILHRELGARIVSYAGGDMRNAIPREAHVDILIDAGSEPQLQKIVEEYRMEITSQFESTAPGLLLELMDGGEADTVIEKDSQLALLNTLNSCTDGVVKMSESIPGIVQTSTNLAIVRLGSGAGEAKLLLRSSDDEEKAELAQQMKGLFEMSGGKVTLAGAYPGWLPNVESPVLAKALETYEKLYNNKPKVKVIHAGLECGIIGGKYPKLDMLSFGPTIRFPHSPDEKVHIASVEKFWEFLRKLLAEVN